MRLLVLGVCAVLGLLCLVTRDKPAAQATPPEPIVLGDNTEDVALARWQTNQARHWRHVVTRR